MLIYSAKKLRVNSMKSNTMKFSTKRMGFPRYRDVKKLQQMISYGQINYLQ